MNSAFFDAVRETVFGGSLTQDQVDGCNVICEAWEDYGDGDHQKLAYLLGTAYHETAFTMQPIHERGQRSYFDKYEPGTKIGRDLGNTKPGDGFLYRGRGYVQCTGRANYAKAQAKLGVPLLTNPDGALDPLIAARILIEGCMAGWFTTKKLRDYIDGGVASYIGARRVVNGQDKAKTIAEYALHFEQALEAAAKAPATTPATEPEKPASEPRNWIAALLELVVGVLAKLWKR